MDESQAAMIRRLEAACVNGRVDGEGFDNAVITQGVPTVVSASFDVYDTAWERERGINVADVIVLRSIPLAQFQRLKALNLRAMEKNVSDLDAPFFSNSKQQEAIIAAIRAELEAELGITNSGGTVQHENEAE